MAHSYLASIVRVIVLGPLVKPSPIVEGLSLPDLAAPRPPRP